MSVKIRLTSSAPSGASIQRPGKVTAPKPAKIIGSRMFMLPKPVPATPKN